MDLMHELTWNGRWLEPGTVGSHVARLILCIAKVPSFQVLTVSRGELAGLVLKSRLMIIDVYALEVKSVTSISYDVDDGLQ